MSVTTDTITAMTKRHAERKVGYREPKPSGKLAIPTPPLLSRRTVYQPGATLAGHGHLGTGFTFAITRQRNRDRD
jgi:hypothetical protein